MSKKDDTIKALKKKLKKLKAEFDALKSPGKKADKKTKKDKGAENKAAKSKEAKSKDAKSKSGKSKSGKLKVAKTLKKSKAKSVSQTPAPPAVKAEPMKVIAKEPTPLAPMAPARIANG